MSGDTLVIGKALAEKLMPFTIMFDALGNVTTVSTFVAKLWNLKPREITEQLQDNIYVGRPFNSMMNVEWLQHMTNMTVSIHFGSNETAAVRGAFYQHERAWVFTGFPEVATVTELESLGLQLSDLPAHISLGALLIANETNAISLGDARSKASEAVRSSENLNALNERFQRFVPTQMLADIGIKNPTETALGRHVETHKAVMFADLRAFTGLSEALEAHQIFSLINEFLSCTVPPIEDHGGYVVQYLGDGIMALFPGGTGQAIEAAIAMQRALQDFTMPAAAVFSPLRMSIGIHEGPVALGIVGNASRWDASIIADAVNTSSRIESMTRILGGEILVSEEYLNGTNVRHKFLTRELGAHQIRGRKGYLQVVEILDALSDDERKSREVTASDFSEGLLHYKAGDLYASMSCFSRVLSVVPDDQAALYYLGRISQRLQGMSH